MNTHLKQLWAAMKLPKNFKKSYKFFCRGLDIRVSDIMDSYVFHTCVFAASYHFVREIGLCYREKSLIRSNHISG